MKTLLTQATEVLNLYELHSNRIDSSIIVYGK